MQQPRDVEPELGPGERAVERTVERTLERTLVGEPVVGPERLLRIARQPTRSSGRAGRQGSSEPPRSS